jgi:CheY-like chemotaxis protein
VASILVVDDDPDIRDLLGAILRAAGYEVRDAENGRVALDAVLERVPDLVVLDLAMPEMDGCRFLEELRARGLRKRTRVIVVTGRDVGHDLPDVRRHLLKPFETSDLLDAVRQSLAEPPDELYARRAREGTLQRLLENLDKILD